MKRMIFILIGIIIFLSSCFKESNSIVYSIEKDNLKYNGPNTTECITSCVKVNVLVIPVNFISSRKTLKNKEIINDAFNSEELLFESVKTYYYKSSYGKLDLNFDVLDWYTPMYSKSYYENLEDESNFGASNILREALDYYDEEIDYRNYDSDNDKIIDAVWMVHNNYKDSSTKLWWALSHSDNSNKKYDGLYARYYSFASIDHIDELDGIDSTTLIHETGHLMGLDDYYSYDNQISGGLYGLDMMDSDVMDHISISKILLGWVKPIIINSDTVIEISDFSSSGEVILISDHEVKSIYDEYFLIDYYTPTGLNSYHDRFKKGPFSVSGIRIYHVDASVKRDDDGNVIENDLSSFYHTGFYYNNSISHKFVELIDSNDEYELTPKKFFPYETYKLLFTDTSLKFGIDIGKNLNYYSSSKLNFSLEVLKLDNKANLSIIFEKEE